MNSICLKTNDKIPKLKIKCRQQNEMTVRDVKIDSQSVLILAYTSLQMPQHNNNKMKQHNLSHVHPKFDLTHIQVRTTWTCFTGQQYKRTIKESPLHNVDFMCSLLSFLYRSFSVGSLSKCHWTIFSCCLLYVFIVLPFRAKI